MPENFKKKNSPPKFLDILTPKKDILKKIKKEDKFNKFLNPSFSKSSINHSLKLLSFILILISIGGMIFAFKNYKMPKIETQKYATEFQDFYQKFDFLKITSDNTQSIENQNLTSKFKQFFYFLEDNLGLIPNILSNVYEIMTNLNNFLINWPQIVLGEYDGKFLRQDFINLFNSINDLKTSLANKKYFENFSNNAELFFWQTELNRFSNFLEHFINWLDSGPHRILVLFLNTSEMRPGGGFLGSYAEVEIKDWKINSFKILDIVEPDREFKEKIIPPKPLQNKIKSWKAADANWFFDFSLSISKIIDFLERSDFYKKNNTIFDGAIILTPAVFEDLLKITAPIYVGTTTFSADNFLFEIQKTIESERLSKSPHPKLILEKIFSEISNKIKLLNDDQKNNIIKYIPFWIQNKDFTLYFKDKNLASFFEDYGLTPKLFKLPSEFVGEYLAVVDANLASGKSDIFIKKIVNFKIYIAESGLITSELEIQRINNAKITDPIWYRKTNEDFIQIFTPPKVKILNAEGGEDKKIYPLVNYKKEGYKIDDDLKYEQELKEVAEFPQIKTYPFQDKNVFATFLSTSLGKTSVLNMKYFRQLPFSLKNNQKFSFILERQIGDQGEYNIEIYAPPGFKFQENNSILFQYQSKNSAVQTIINLTLIENI